MGCRVPSRIEIKMGDLGKMRCFALGVNFINRAVFLYLKNESVMDQYIKRSYRGGLTLQIKNYQAHAVSGGLNYARSMKVTVFY